MYQNYTAALNAPDKPERLAALRKIIGLHKTGALGMPEKSENVNNHIHTTYSFSPYSPSKAAYAAWKSGLATAGIMDHDSVAGAEEFLEAGKIAGIATTVGFELRCDLRGTPLMGRKTNNPDQTSVTYLTMHGIPHGQIARAEKFLRPCREKRNIRNRAMVEKLNLIFEKHGVALDFCADVVPVSNCRDGGSITERHILFALSKKIIEKTGRGTALVNFLADSFGISVTGANLGRIMDVENEMYAYFLLNILKGQLVERFYIDATDECPPVSEFLGLAGEIGAIPAYPYLGDVSDSVTGDKKKQAFEDGYLDELVEYAASAGFKALTFMPTRNTPEQLARVMALCEKHGLFQICGEDINSPFQPFVCEALKKPEFKHLVRAAWALIGHERAERGMFSAEMIEQMPELGKRIEHFAKLGLKAGFNE